MAVTYDEVLKLARQLPKDEQTKLAQELKNNLRVQILAEFEQQDAVQQSQKSLANKYTSPQAQEKTAEDDIQLIREIRDAWKEDFEDENS